MSYPVLSLAVIITPENNAIRMAELTTATATVAPGVYWLRGSGAQDLCTAIKAALEAATASINVYQVRIEDFSANAAQPSARFVVAAETGDSDLTLLLGASQTTFPVELLGLERTTYGPTDIIISPKSPGALWVGSDMLTLDEPDSDGDVFGDAPTRGGVYLAGARSREWRKWQWRTQYIAAARTHRRANLTDPNATWESFWGRAREGQALELGRMATPTSAPVYQSGRWIMDELTRQTLNATRLSPGSPLYSWPMAFREAVTP